MQNEIKNIFRQKNNFDSSKDNEEKLYMLKLKNMYLLRDNESGIVYTNNRILDSEIRRFKDIGITNEKREKAKFILSLCGGGGLYQPNYFYKDILNKDLFMKLCPTSDDIWFSIQNVLQNNYTVVIGLPENPFGYKHFISTNLLRDKNQTDEFRLTKINSVFGNKNSENLNNVLNYYKDELNEIYKKLDNSN